MLQYVCAYFLLNRKRQDENYNTVLDLYHLSFHSFAKLLTDAQLQVAPLGMRCNVSAVLSSTCNNLVLTKFLDFRYFIFYWRCPHSMRSRVCVTIGRPSVRLSHRSTAAAVASRFLLLNAVRVGDIDGQLQAPVPRTSCRRAQQQRRRSTALSSECGQCHVESRGRGWTQTCFFAWLTSLLCLTFV